MDTCSTQEASGVEITSFGTTGSLFQRKHSPQNAVVFACRDRTALGPKQAAVYLEGSLDQQESGLDGGAVKEGGSRQGSDSRGGQSELFMFMLKTEKVPEDD